jgi:acetate kinase
MGPLSFLGVAIDAPRDAVAQADTDVSASGASVRTLVVAAREDVEMGRQGRAVLAAGA